MTFVLFPSITFGVLHTVRTVNEQNTDYTFSENKYYPTITRLFCFGKECTSNNRQCNGFCNLLHSYRNSSCSCHGKTIKKKKRILQNTIFMSIIKLYRQNIQQTSIYIKRFEHIKNTVGVNLFKISRNIFIRNKFLDI